MKKASFHLSRSQGSFNEGSYIRSSVIRQSTCLSEFLREKGELRLLPFTVEEEERIANPRPKTQTERILTLCAEERVGLRETIAESRLAYRC